MRIVTAGAGRPPGIKSSLLDLVARAAHAPFPPTATDPRILLSDWSMYQGEVDIGKHLAYAPPKFKGVVIRSGQGQYSSYDDSKFQQNVQMCEANDFPWMLYHVSLPNQNAEPQVNHLYEILNRLKGPTPKWIWWDVEVSNGMSKKRVSDVTINSLLLTKQIIDINTGVYSAQWYSDGYMETQDRVSSNTRWIAQWITPTKQKEPPWPTALPETVDLKQVMIHQTTSYGDGKLCGVGSTRLDLDRWMWTEEQFNDIMELDEEPPIPNGDIENRIERNEQDIAELKSEVEYLREKQVIVDEWIESYGTSTA